jgi:signal recognition particle receptor subunit beta
MLTVRYSSLATKFYYRAEDSNRPDLVEPALRRLSNANGIIFVADSQDVRSQHNTGALARLRADLLRYGVSLDELPVVFQLNKRDLSGIMEPEDMKAQLNTRHCSYVETVASQCRGVLSAVESLLRML